LIYSNFYSFCHCVLVLTPAAIVGLSAGVIAAIVIAVVVVLAVAAGAGSRIASVLKRKSFEQQSTVQNNPIYEPASPRLCKKTKYSRRKSAERTEAIFIERLR